LGWDGGDPWPADGENTAARWFSLRDLPAMSLEMRGRIHSALVDVAAHFTTAAHPTWFATGVLLDMDGTLLDSSAAVDRVWRDFAQQHGLPAGEVLAHAHGRRAVDTVRHFLPGSA